MHYRITPFAFKFSLNLDLRCVVLRQQPKDVNFTNPAQNTPKILNNIFKLTLNVWLPFQAREPSSNTSVHVRVTNHSIGYHGCSWAAGDVNQCTQTECTTVVTDADVAASVKLAREADFAVVSVALTSTEGYDRDNLSLGEFNVNYRAPLRPQWSHSMHVIPQ